LFISFPDSSVITALLFDMFVISSAECLLFSASLRISDATTANPLPCSPALAASTARIIEI